MLYGGDGPGPLLTAAHANGWKMEDTDRNNCLSWLIILCVGLADNCTFIFTTKYTDTLCKESSWSRLLSLPKEETWFIAPSLIKLEIIRQEQIGTSQVTVPE